MTKAEKQNNSFSAGNRRSWVWWLLAVVLVACALAFYYFINPSSALWFPRCPIKFLTGFSCPGCGGQRATHALLHGNVGEALSYNYFYIIAIPFVIALFVSFVLKKLHKGKRFVSLVEHKAVVWTVVATAILWTIARNVLNI